MEHNRLKKFLRVGPGGMHCPCCYPAPGTKERKKLIRAGRRREATDAFKIEELNFYDDPQ